jgi:hypothetical protein
MTDIQNFHFNWIPSCFNIIGCEYSTDIDIIIPVPNQQIIQDYRNAKFVLNLDLVKYDLVDLGFNLIIKELDINLVYLDPKTSNIIDSLIGEPKLTQNIIHYTYKLHPQTYPPIVKYPVEIDLANFVRLFSKIVLDWMEKLLGNTRYKELRPIKAKVYTNLISRLDFSFQILCEVNFVQLFQTNPNIIKSLGMKLSQIVLVYNDSLEYTKKNISMQVNKIIPSINYDEMLFILSRGKLGHQADLLGIKKIFDCLILQYQQIILEIKSSYNMEEIQINMVTYLTNTSDFDIQEFIKSPEKPTLALANWINEKYQLSGSLNKIFEMKSFGCDLLPTSLLEHIHTENQRSSPWLDLLKFYQCGNTINNSIPFVDCEINFNLIRGCLGEKLVVNLVDWDKLVGEPVSKCMCGLLVETKGLEKSIGIAPDLLLVNTNSNQVIPVEIKTLVSNPNIVNRKLLRDFDLASKQLNTSIELIEKNTGIKTYGLMIFCFIDLNQITVKYKKYFI